MSSNHRRSLCLATVLFAGCAVEPETIIATSDVVPVRLNEGLEVIFHFTSVKGKYIEVNSSIDRVIRLKIYKQDAPEVVIVSDAWVWKRGHEERDRVNFEFGWPLVIEGAIYNSFLGALEDCVADIRDRCYVEDNFRKVFRIIPQSPVETSDLFRPDLFSPDLTPAPSDL